MAKVGDMVRFLNSTGGGKVVRVQNNMAYVEDEDGFETPVLLREIVVVGESPKAEPKIKPFTTPPKSETSSPKIQEPEHDEDETVFETPEGDKLNVVLAFEPENLKEISETPLSVYLVNDSNYYLYFTFSTRENENEQWLMRYAGMVEPNIQIFLEEVDRMQLNSYENVMLQFIAFKEGKNFEAKKPVSVVHRIDTTKFFKLHCFADNIYFDSKVIALPIVTDDEIYAPKKIDHKKLEAEMRQKKRLDQRRRTVPVVKRTERRNNEVIEVDLHITELLDDIRGLSNSDMLNLQIDEFRRVMDANINNHGQKIVFIHGKGEGVLRNAIMKELNYRYKGHTVQDASFREYGFGATQVTI